MMQDSQRLLTAVIEFLEASDFPGAPEFSKLAAVLMNAERQHKGVREPESIPSAAARNSKSSEPSSTTSSAARKQLQQQMYRHTVSSMSEADLLSEQEKLRRAAVRRRDQLSRNGRASIDLTATKSSMSKREARHSVSHLPASTKPSSNLNPPNLDYLSLSSTHMESPTRSPSSTHQALFPPPTTYPPRAPDLSSTEWESVLSSIDNGQSNLWDAIYGGGPNLSLNDDPALEGWADDTWDMKGAGIAYPVTSAQSVLSFSEESLSSSEDLSASELGVGSGKLDYQNALLPGLGDGADYLLDGFDGMFGA